VHRAIEFLEDGDRIKVTVRFRGRELTHPELGRNLLAKFVDRVKDHGVAERTPLLEGKSMHITMASVHKPKTHDAPNPRSAEAPEPKTGPAATPAKPAPAATAAPEPAAEATAPSEAPAEAKAAGPVAVATKTEPKKIAQHTPAPEPVTSGE
jgi:translation initiation factor IF-3